MLAAIDATSWANRRGYGRFARNALTALVEADRDTRYVLVCDETTAARDDLPERAEVLRVAARRAAVDGAAASSQRPWGDLYRMSRAVSRLAPDVVLFPSVYTWFPVVRVPTVVGVHDLIADEVPELTLPSRGARARWRLKRFAAVRRATRVFTVSQTSRAVVAAGCGIPADTVTVVPEAPDAIFGPRRHDEVASQVSSLGLLAGEPYVLYVGGISPHKGLDTLLEAYGGLAGDPPRLVIVGALEDEAYLSAAGSVRRQIADGGLGDRVLLPGYVSDETLAALYAGALVFVSPSRFEGFGLPAVEAAVSRTAVVLSDIPAHRESMGDAAVFFPVGDEAALRAALERVVGDESLREHLTDAAALRVAGMTWARAGEALRGVLLEAVRG